jgi:hypothetical protein
VLQLFQFHSVSPSRSLLLRPFCSEGPLEAWCQGCHIANSHYRSCRTKIFGFRLMLRCPDHLAKCAASQEARPSKITRGDRFRFTMKGEVRRNASKRCTLGFRPVDLALEKAWRPPTNQIVSLFRALVPELPPIAAPLGPQRIRSP